MSTPQRVSELCPDAYATILRIVQGAKQRMQKEESLKFELTKAADIANDEGSFTEVVGESLKCIPKSNT